MDVIKNSNKGFQSNLEESDFNKNTTAEKEKAFQILKEYRKIYPLSLSNKLFEKAIEELKKIENKNVDFQLFVDERNVENYVFHTTALSYVVTASFVIPL